MNISSQSVYQNYQKDYHRLKAIYLKKMLGDLPKYVCEFFGSELNEDDLIDFRHALKSDLRQTYFHAIETFFELFFALKPGDGEKFNDSILLEKLSTSNWRAIYKEIKKISENIDALDFLDEIIQFNGFEISVGQYLFYMGFFSKDKFSDELFKEIKESVEAIKHGIRIIAADFVNRDEYNAYKHGLRVIPAFSQFFLFDTETKKLRKELDLSDSMSFYGKSENPDELKIKTILFDTERDYQMISMCSNFINHLIFYRRITMKFENDKDRFKEIPLTFFGKKEIDNCAKQNVEIQNLEFIVKLK